MSGRKIKAQKRNISQRMRCNMCFFLFKPKSWDKCGAVSTSRPDTENSIEIFSYIIFAFYPIAGSSGFLFCSFVCFFLWAWQFGVMEPVASCVNSGRTYHSPLSMNASVSNLHVSAIVRDNNNNNKISNFRCPSTSRASLYRMNWSHEMKERTTNKKRQPKTGGFSIDEIL